MTMPESLPWVLGDGSPRPSAALPLQKGDADLSLLKSTSIPLSALF